MTYTSDVIIYPGRVVFSWQRRESHNLEAADLTYVIAEKPQIIVIGTGAYDVMKGPEDTIFHLESQGVPATLGIGGTFG